MNTPSTFYFERYEYHPETHQALFYYSYDRATSFCEVITFPNDMPDCSDQIAFDAALFSLHLMLGIGYWKAYAVSSIVVESGSLSASQAAFWNTVYTKGLGEFFYHNQLPMKDRIRFPVDEHATSKASPVSTTHHSLVLMGGGKDSLMALRVMQDMQKPFDSMSLGAFPIIDHQVQELGLHHLLVRRIMDPQLSELNKQGVYNGHVPISAILAFTALAVSIAYGYRWSIVANEQSANEGNVLYEGEMINHQWSKSWEFEQRFQEYIRTFITEDVGYFSILRPLHELAIARWIGEHIDRVPSFVSCNRAFTQNSSMRMQWCGTCAKCLFAFVILAPFVEKEELVKRFGKNLLNDSMLLALLQQLVGKKEHKPFDCVGTVEEVTVALALIVDKGEYADSPLIAYATEKVLPEISDMAARKKRVFTLSEEHAIPPEFQSYLHGLSS